MSDRYKNEIEKILENTPNLPEEQPILADSQKSNRDQIVHLFHLSRERKLGSVSSFTLLVLSGLLFFGFMGTKFNLFAVLSVTFLLLSYLTYVCPISFWRPRMIWTKFMSRCVGLFKKTRI